MSQTCRVCSSPDRKVIEQKIMSNISHTQIARGYEGITNQSIRYHTRHHLSKTLLKLQEKGEIQHFKSMSEEIDDLIVRTKSILDHAESKKKHKLSLRAIDSLRSTYQFVCQIGAYLNEQQQRDESQGRRKTIDDYSENLSYGELSLLRVLLEKAETGKLIPEITDTEGLVKETEVQRQVREAKNTSSQFRREEVDWDFKSDSEDSIDDDIEDDTEDDLTAKKSKKRTKSKFKKRRRRAKWDFEDEEKEEDGEDDGVGENSESEESKKEGKKKKGRKKTEVVESVKDTDSIQGRNMCPGITSVGRTLDGRSVSDL